MLAIQTRGRRMVGADETTKLWRAPQDELFSDNSVRSFEIETRHKIQNDEATDEIW